MFWWKFCNKDKLQSFGKPTQFNSLINNFELKDLSNRLLTSVIGYFEWLQNQIKELENNQAWLIQYESKGDHPQIKQEEEILPNRQDSPERDQKKKYPTETTIFMDLKKIEN